MSLYIRTDDITAVLLADGWHEVAERSFDIDAYEYLEGRSTVDDDDEPLLLHNGGRQGCAAGFTFKEPGTGRIDGPMTSVLAIRRPGGC